MEKVGLGERDGESLLPCERFCQHPIQNLNPCYILSESDIFPPEHLSQFVIMHLAYKAHLFSSWLELCLFCFPESSHCPAQFRPSINT